MPTLLLLACWLQPAPVSAADDAAADFSALPRAGVRWGYGWSPTLGGPFQPSQANPSSEWMDRWVGRGDATIGRNSSQRMQSSNTAVVPPGQLVLHPGQGGEYAVLRWTAAAAGLYRLHAVFDRRDHAYPTTTDVHVLRNGRLIFDAAVDRRHRQATLRTDVSMAAGGTLDFAVGWGANRSYNGDATGLHAVITRLDAAPVSNR